MRTRSRLLWSFLSAHIALSLVVGLLAYHLLHNFLRSQAEESARSLASVLAAGGFTLSERIQERMAELSGYDFSLFTATLEEVGDAPPGTIQVPYDRGVIRVHYHTPAYSAAVRTLFIATLILGLGGTIVFALIAWRLSQHLASPLERLALSARAIGDGQWQQAVPLVGSGEVLRLAKDLDIMREQLLDLDQRNRQAERLATLGTFTATIAHEVRNPLSAIRLSIQLLRQSHQGDAALAMIEDEIERLDHIVDELLGYSRGMSVSPEECELAEVAADVHRLLGRQAQHAGAEITLSGKARVLGDPRRLRQLLLNLVLNAVQAVHGSDDGQVLISIHQDGLVVSDNGPGVPAAQVAELFRPFTSGREHGTGLGLHLANLIAEAHHASLTYEPGQPQGSRFILSGLPPAEQAAAQPESVQKSS